MSDAMEFEPIGLREELIGIATVANAAAGLLDSGAVRLSNASLKVLADSLATLETRCHDARDSVIEVVAERRYRNAIGVEQHDTLKQKAEEIITEAAIAQPHTYCGWAACPICHERGLLPPGDAGNE